MAYFDRMALDTHDFLITHFNDNLAKYVAEHSGEYVMLRHGQGDTVSEQFYKTPEELGQARQEAGSLYRLFCFDHRVPAHVEGNRLQTFQEFMEGRDVIPSEVIERAVHEAFREVRRAKLRNQYRSQ